MSAPTLTNSVADAAETIRDLLAASDAAALQSIDKALEAGHHLVTAKKATKHGQWLPFLKRADVSERKAQRLMQLAESGLKPVTVSDLGGIKGALEFLNCRSRSVAAMRVIEMSMQKGGTTPDEMLARFALRINGVELLRDATEAMFDCFIVQDRVEAQREDSELDAEEFAKRIMQPIDDYILADRDPVERGSLAMAALRLCETAPSGGSAEVLLRVLMTLNRLDNVSADEVIAQASKSALEQIAVRAA